jgi:hypothetical protein
MSNALAIMERRIGDLAPSNMTVGEIKRLLKLDWATENDLVMFGSQCQQYGLNPFANEIFMIPFKDGNTIKPSIVVAEKVFAARGMASLIAQGYKIAKVRNWAEGGFGYFQIYIKGEKEPLVDIKVSFGEKSTGRGMWVIESKKGIMLKKAARLDGWRLIGAHSFYHPQEIPGVETKDLNRALEVLGEIEIEEPTPGPVTAAALSAPIDAPEVSDDDLAAAAQARHEEEEPIEVTPEPVIDSCSKCGKKLKPTRIAYFKSEAGKEALKTMGTPLCGACEEA